MLCINGTCGCNGTGFWSGSQCQYTINFRAICTSNSNCFKSLVCQDIPCIDSNKRCSCPSNTYYSPSHQNCTSCSGSDGTYDNYVINYPTSDLCVAVRMPTSSRTYSITFSTAQSQCNNLTAMANASTPQLLSVHNQTELNCIATVLKSVNDDGTCNDNRLYYLGFTAANLTFFDGTSYNSAFSSPTISSSQCLTYCYNSDNIGSLYANSCNDGTTDNLYGAICNYKVS